MIKYQNNGGCNMTNFEHIKEIVNDGNFHMLRDFIVNVGENICDICPGCKNKKCADAIFRWLSADYDANSYAWKRFKKPRDVYMIRKGK